MWEKSISSKKNPYNLRQGSNNEQINVIKLNFVHTILFIDAPSATDLESSSQVQWLFLRSKYGFSQKLKKYIQVFDWNRALISLLS